MTHHNASQDHSNTPEDGTARPRGPALLVARESASLVEEALCRYYRQQADSDEWNNSILHASDLGYATGELCLRQWWLRVHGAEQSTTTYSQALMFDHGHRIHERLSDVLAEVLPTYGWKVTAIEKAVEALGVHGRADVLMEDATGGYRIVVDWKTQRGKSFDWLDYQDEAKPTHVAQVQFYAMATDADGAVVVYVDREGQNGIRAYPVERNDAATRERVALMQQTWKQGQPPPVLSPEVKRRVNKGPDSLEVSLPWQCRYCPMLDVSCDGAIPRRLRMDGIVAKDHGDRIIPRDGCDELVEWASNHLGGAA